ncbi:hypothetical protein L1887_09269 [Cichorium endivia]|nr:hypothetical protein L1887_09269 [Cichorium endivia]
MVQEATYDFLLSQMEPLGSKEKEMDFKIQHPYFIPPRDIVFVEVDKDDIRFASTSEYASSCEEMASTMMGAESSVLKGLQQCIDIVIAEVDRSSAYGCVYKYSKYPTSIAALSFSRDGRLLVVASCYTFEEGDKPHEPDAIFVRSMNEVEVKPKPKQYPNPAT